MIQIPLDVEMGATCMQCIWLNCGGKMNIIAIRYVSNICIVVQQCKLINLDYEFDYVKNLDFSIFCTLVHLVELSKNG